MNHDEFASFIKLLAEESGKIIRPYFANPDLEIEFKADQSPVTEADRNAEKAMRAMINERFPDHGIIGEEFGNENTDAKYVWSLDPVDGTKPFSAGCPLFGTLICLLEDGQPILGAINNPVTRQLLLGDGKTTTLNGMPVQVKENNDLSTARVAVSGLNLPAEYQDAERWNRLVERTGQLVTWGDCYGYLLVCTGGVDIMADPIMNPWDLLALIPAVRGAGGVITDWHGGDPVSGKSIIAAPPGLHAQVIEILNG